MNRSGNRGQIGQHRGGRLVAIARILPQQTLHDFVQRTRHGDSQAPQLGDIGGHVFKQYRAEFRARKRRTPGKAMEQRDPGRIKIGGLGNILIDRTDLLGRKIQRGIQRSVLKSGLVQPKRRCGIEVNQPGLGHLLSAVDDNVAGPHATVQQSMFVQVAQCGKHPVSHDERFRHGQPP